MFTFDQAQTSLRSGPMRAFHLLLAYDLHVSSHVTSYFRISLLTILFPLFSMSLCAWMTVFGFYLRLEDRAKREEKRKLAKDVLEKGFHTYW